VLVSTPRKRGGWYPEIAAEMVRMSAELAEPMKQMPIYEV
jgi:hypothetical protein